jgi:hypothetical protein
MQSMTAVRIATIAVVTGAACLGATPRPSQSLQGAQRLGWIAGCWERSGGATIVEEQWMRPRGGAMLGVSRTTRRDTVVEYEQLRIFDRGGRTVYAAMPSGQAPAEFETSVTSDTAVTFENPAHDFPQRIIYRKRGADSLIARIEGLRNGTVRGVDFPYKRVACP